MVVLLKQFISASKSRTGNLVTQLEKEYTEKCRLIQINGYLNTIN